MNAKSRLYSLAKEKAICEAQYQGLGRPEKHFRPRRHARSDDIQRLVDLCDAVTVLMYHLVFSRSATRAVTATTPSTAGGRSTIVAVRRPRKRLPSPPTTCGKIPAKSTVTTSNTGSPPKTISRKESTIGGLTTYLAPGDAHRPRLRAYTASATSSQMVRSVGPEHERQAANLDAIPPRLCLLVLPSCRYPREPGCGIQCESAMAQ